MSKLDGINTFFGIYGGGNCLPGPYHPFGLVKPGPDSPVPHETNGLSDKTQTITGFSQNHVSGTGGNGRYGNISVMPFTGSPVYACKGLKRNTENGRVGYYRTEIEGGITHEITCSERVAFHRSTFTEGMEKGVVIDPLSMIRKGMARTGHTTPDSITGFIEWTNTQSCHGWGVYKGGWGHDFPYQVFFYIHFDKPLKMRAVIKNEQLVKNYWGDGNSIMAVGYTENNQILMRIGISYVGIANARYAVEQKKHETFDAIEKENRKAWADILSNIEVEGKEEECNLFYSAYYRLLSMPTDLGLDENSWWKSSKRNFSDYYCFWDSVRNANSLMIMLHPDLMVDILQDQIDIAEHIGWFPDAWIVGHSAQVQGGCSVDTVITEAALKGIEGVDYDKALHYMVKNAEEPSHDPWLHGRFHDDYQKLGYVSDNVKNCVSRHIEYAFQDHCISLLAKFLGKDNIAQKYENEAQKTWNLWRDDINCFAPRSCDGSWVDFDPYKPACPDYWNDPHYYEGVGHEWTLSAPYIIDEIIKRMGGRNKFSQHLDNFFEKGMYGWKEIIVHTPYLYHYVNNPSKVNKTLHKIITKKYSNTHRGLPDNEDMGCHSAFIMATGMGLYPIMGSTKYWLSIPRLNSTQIKLQSGNTLTIIKKENASINSTTAPTFNDKILTDWMLDHKDIQQGGTLVFA